MGLIIAVVVHAANVQDRDGAKQVFEKLAGSFRRLKLIWADAAYAGQLVNWVSDHLSKTLEIVKAISGAHTFVVQPKRWIVERTFGWLGRYRRLSKDYEELTHTSEAMILIASINILLHRLHPG
jgi:putative transposase